MIIICKIKCEVYSFVRRNSYTDDDILHYLVFFIFNEEEDKTKEFSNGRREELMDGLIVHIYKPS